MDLKNQVVSLELAKQLKGLGIEQESLFYWFNPMYVTDRIEKRRWLLTDYIHNSQNEKPDNAQNPISAYIATELLEILPKEINSDNNYFMYIYYNTENDFVVKYADYNNKYIALVEDKSLCNALAKMLIYLKTNKLIE